MRLQLAEKIVTYFLWIAIALLLIWVVLPQGTGLPAIFRTRKVFNVAMLLLAVKTVVCFYRNPKSRFLELVPFLVLLLIPCFQLARIPSYNFGVDDSYYYSYLGSVWLDHDLDLSNQFQASGLFKYLTQKALGERTALGFMPNIYPAGLAVFWSPFFGFGYLVAKLAELPLDGFSRPFVFSVIMGNVFYICAGLYMCFLFGAKFFARWVSLLCTLALFFTTPSLYVSYRLFLLLSEPLSLTLAACLFVLAIYCEDKLSPLLWGGIGILLGLTIMVRFHNVVFGFAPGIVLLSNARKNGFSSRLVMAFASLVLGTMIGFLPQLLVWRMLYGEWFLSLAGAFLPWWKNPFFLETLFSSRKGLFPWAPVTALCVIGLPIFLKKNRVWGFILIVIFAIGIWINSSQFDWWGATSLGSRRFVPFVVIFSVALATLYSLLPRFGKIILVFLVCFMIPLNIYFARSFSRGQFQYEHADRFSDILQDRYLAYRYAVYPLEFPVQLAYHLKYGTPMYGPLNEFFIGEDVFYFQHRAGDQILAPESPILGSGWTRGGERKTTGRNAIVYIPMFMKEKPRFFMVFDLEPTGTEKDVWIDFYWNGKFLRSRKVFLDGRSIEIAIRSKEYRSAVNELRMHIYHSRRENETPPELILRKVEFRRDQVPDDES